MANRREFIKLISASLAAYSAFPSLMAAKKSASQSADCFLDAWLSRVAVAEDIGIRSAARIRSD